MMRLLLFFVKKHSYGGLPIFLHNEPVTFKKKGVRFLGKTPLYPMPTVSTMTQNMVFVFMNRNFKTIFFSPIAAISVFRI